VSPLSGQVTSPQNQGETSATFALQAQLTGGCGSPCSATGYGGVTFQYRVGASGSFTNIPAADVTNGANPVTWPVATSALSTGDGVDSPALTWQVTQTVQASGLLQVQAVFTDSSGDSYTTSPVTVSFDATGTGGDFATSQVGPVTVGLQSGDLSLPATDVSIQGYGMGLSVSRTFNSLATGGSSSLFGPGWTASLPVPGSSMNWSSVTDDGSYAVLTDSGGTTYTFAAGTPANGVTPYTAQGTASAAGLTLTKSSSGFTLADPSGDQVQFTAADSSTPDYYTPAQVTTPGTSRSVGYIYDATSTDASYGKPLLMVGPNAHLSQSTPSTTACPYPVSSTTWTDGCRALEFIYDPATGNMSEIDFVYMHSGSLSDVPVANYSYDSSGRLASEWDPRLSPGLVTSYSYDENTSDSDYGKLTAYTPAQSVSGSLAPWKFGYDATAGSVGDGKLITVTRTSSTGTASTYTIDYNVPLTTAAGGPVNMDPATVATWNQTDVPASAVAIFPPSHVPASPPSGSDWNYPDITYYDAYGRQVNTAHEGAGAWNVTTTQYDGYGDVISQLTASNRAEALAAGSSSAAVAAELETVTSYTTSADGSQLTDKVHGPLHNASVPGQGTEEIRDETHYVYDQNAPAGGPYDLVTTQAEEASIGAGIPGTSVTDVRDTDFVYNNGTDDIGWTLRSPLEKIVAPDPLKITTTTAYNEDSSLYGGEPLTVETCMPSSTSCSGAGAEKYVYYTLAPNPVDPACGDHPVWTDLLCATEPAAQPGTPGLPDLPVTRYTYDFYRDVLKKTETFGSSTRTTTYTYNAIQQPITTTVTTSGSGMGTAVQETKNIYSPATGLLQTQETLDSTGTVTGTIQYGYDDFGQLTSYTDASGNTTTYTYTKDGLVQSADDGKGKTSYAYGVRQVVKTETDSQAGTFTATYNPDGNLSTETYPGGLTASYGYDETGTPTSLSYAGESWTSPLTDSVVPNAHGDWASQSITDTTQSLASNQAYTYDNADRLTSVQDTQNGQCTTRTYAYDADSNRTSLTTYSPASDGSCQNTTGTTASYAYDPADRLTNTGYTYDTQGDITTIPSSDAGGNGNLTATYYANNMLASQTQNGQTTTWQLDPTGQRFGSFVANGFTYKNHYSGTSSNPAWMSGSDGSWIRCVADAKGSLGAEATSSGVTLELRDLHGDIIATGTTSSASTGPASTQLYNEFGVVEGGAPGTYGWLGSDYISSDALGSQLLMGVRAYDPSTGRFSQTDPISGGSANLYDYAFQNPLTNYDLSGEAVWRWWTHWDVVLEVWFNKSQTWALWSILRGLANPWILSTVYYLPWWLRDVLLYYLEHFGGGIWEATEDAIIYNECVVISFYIWGTLTAARYGGGWCN
jgi:RHS repeat-associated protein